MSYIWLLTRSSQKHHLLVYSLLVFCFTCTRNLFCCIFYYNASQLGQCLQRLNLLSALILHPPLQVRILIYLTDGINGKNYKDQGKYCGAIISTCKKYM